MPPSTKKKIPVTDLILFGLEKFVEGGELIVGTSNDLRDWMNEVYGISPKNTNKYALSQAIKRLRQRRLIEQDDKNAEKIIIRLTQEGKIFLLAKKNASEIDWDGKWRIVIFDIPESKKLVRNVLRRKLKSWGFERWQKSVWASKKNLTEPLRSLIKDLEIEDWVLVIESGNVGF